MTLTKDVLLKYFSVKESTIKTNFPLFCSKQLAKGYLIEKHGKGNSATYEVSQVEPQIVDKTQFSTRPSIICEDLPNEIWKTCYYSINYEVSNLGRVRNKRTKVLSNCCEQKDGYVSVSFENTNYRLHRAILATFNPIENMEDFTVDHINGIRNDNRVENLRWVSNEENILLMTTNRLKLNSEITRLISKYGYDETLVKLKAL